MRLLLIHSDFIEFEAKKKTGMAEEGQPLKGFTEEALTVFCAVRQLTRTIYPGSSNSPERRSPRLLTSSPSKTSSSILMPTSRATWQGRTLRSGL